MAQKPHFAQKSIHGRKSMSLPLTATSASDNPPDAYARDLFKHLEDSWNLLLWIEKKKTFEI